MADSLAGVRQRIVCDPAILVGKPVIRGTRIPVELVLAFLAEKPDFEELFAAYPHLTIDDVRACFAYAHAAVQKRRQPRALSGGKASHAPE